VFYDDVRKDCVGTSCLSPRYKGGSKEDGSNLTTIDSRKPEICKKLLGTC